MAPFAMLAAAAFGYSYRRMTVAPPDSDWLSRARTVRDRPLYVRVFRQDILWQLRVAENPRIALRIAVGWFALALLLLVWGVLLVLV